MNRDVVLIGGLRDLAKVADLLNEQQEEHHRFKTPPKGPDWSRNPKDAVPPPVRYQVPTQKAKKLRREHWMHSAQEMTVLGCPMCKQPERVVIVEVERVKSVRKHTSKPLNISPTKGIRDQLYIGSWHDDKQLVYARYFAYSLIRPDAATSYDKSLSPEKIKEVQERVLSVLRAEGFNV